MANYLCQISGASKAGSTMTALALSPRLKKLLSPPEVLQVQDMKPSSTSPSPAHVTHITHVPHPTTDAGSRTTTLPPPRFPLRAVSTLLHHIQPVHAHPTQLGPHSVTITTSLVPVRSNCRPPALDHATPPTPIALDGPGAGHRVWRWTGLLNRVEQVRARDGRQSRSRSRGRRALGSRGRMSVRT